MFSFPLLKTTAYVLVLSMGLWTCGCVATKYIETDNVRNCKESPVKILTPGGSEYHFRAWTVGDSCIVTSDGEVHNPSMRVGFFGTTFEPFSGAVPLDSIGHCFCQETDVPGSILKSALFGIIVVVPVSYGLYLLISGQKSI